MILANIFTCETTEQKIPTHRIYKPDHCYFFFRKVGTKKGVPYVLTLCNAEKEKSPECSQLRYVLSKRYFHHRENDMPCLSPPHPFFLSVVTLIGF
jgi:hypothetical protein